MGLTHFPHGILATPNLGIAKAGLWSERIFFVDGTNGGSGNEGLDPLQAKGTFQQAVTAAGRDDTIYVRPKSAGVRYIENVVIPATSNADHTKEGMSIIGTGNGGISSTRDQAVILRGVTGINLPAIRADASYANFENIAFLSVPAQFGETHPFALLLRQNSSGGVAGSSGFNVGSAIVNCGFLGDMLNPAAAGEVQMAIHFIATDGHLVEGNHFMDCRVAMASSGDLTGNSCITVKDNLFKGVAANIAGDMYMIDVAGLEIVGNHFLHAVPTHAAGTIVKYIKASGTVTGSISGNFQGASAVAAATNNTILSLIACGNFGLGGPWTS